MPLLDITNPPPSRPAVEEESVKDMELVCFIMKSDPDKMKSVEEGFGVAGPILARWLSKQRMSLLEQMSAHGMERRSAMYDSHDIEGFLNPERGHLRYFRGDTIEVLRRCNEKWAVGLVRGNVGVFPLEYTRSDNFSLVLASYKAANETEVSMKRGQILPTTATTVPGKCQVYTTKEYGLVPQQNLVSLKPPPIQERDRNPGLYYQHAPLSRGHIRLIYITPENAREFEESGYQSLFITISHEPVNKVPAYTAFSYCWGDPTDVTPVFCNGKLLYVPSTLWRLLSWHIPGRKQSVYHQYDASQASRPHDPAIFWADAICINQRDTLEKNHQIPLMRTIYQKASSVMAYAGETDSAMGAGLSMDLIARARQRNRSSSVTSLDEAHDLLGTVDWEAVKRFFSQPLFRRCWVIQEVILSREITFCYGTMRILMSRIHDCSLALSENHARPVHSVLGDTHGPREENSETFKENLRQILNLSRFKAIWDRGGTLPFIDVLQRFRSAEATDPRDKVYSLLGLAPEEYQRAIIPDYSESNTTIDVYEHLARCALQFEDLQVLLPNAGISKKTPTLASWAPDWSYEPRDVISGALFSCSGTRAYGTAHVIPYTHQNRAKLMIRGVIIDKISRTGPRWSPNSECELPDAQITKASGNAPVAFYLTDAFIHLTNRCLESRGGRYPNGDSMSTAIWQTLTCGMMRGENRAVLGDEVHYNAFHECLSDAWKSDRPVLFRGIGDTGVQPVPKGDGKDGDDDINAVLEKLSLDFNLGSLDRTPRGAAGTGVGTSSRAAPRDEAKARKSALEERAMPFLKALVKAQAGRRTCVSEKSYFAAVPDEAKDGDEMAIFFGHPVPYVVRRAGGPDSVGTEQFRLIGHCYVHGIMDGELVDKNPGSGTTFPGFDAMNFALI